MADHKNTKHDLGAGWVLQWYRSEGVETMTFRNIDTATMIRLEKNSVERLRKILGA
mgnify:CR=1 FL=1